VHPRGHALARLLVMLPLAAGMSVLLSAAPQLAR
jgi:hypothetical protein